MKQIILMISFIVAAAGYLAAQEVINKDLNCKEGFEFMQEHSNDPDFVIIDLRPEKMYNEEHIGNAIYFDVFSGEFDDWANRLDKDKTYLIYCTVGQRSKMGFEKMKTMGFTKLYHMYEGIRTWKSQGFPTVKENPELVLVKQAINNVFGWAVNKDFDLFFNTISDDSNFVSVTPYKRVKFGAQAVKNDTAFWASPDFKAISHELYDLKITFSQGGDVAWFYCVLDDINTWKGESANWEKVRWTGVLEKREGKWRVVQQHFSWAKEN